MKQREQDTRGQGYSPELAAAKYDNILTAFASRIGSFSPTAGPFRLQKKLLSRNQIVSRPFQPIYAGKITNNREFIIYRIKDMSL